MERDEMLELWNDMAKEGNWVPSWTDSLAGLTPEEAAWTPTSGCHSAWQEVVHVIFWRKVTLRRMAGGDNPPNEEIEAGELALPASLNTESWAETVAELNRTHADIAAAIQDPEMDCSRVPYHILHDAYHLGRITQLRAMRGVPPKF
jgi:hypothetical protein